VFAYSGMLVGADDRLTNWDLATYALDVAPKKANPKVCYIPTAIGDLPTAVEGKAQLFAERRPEVEFSALMLFTQPNVPDVRRHLLDQDVLIVEGGSVVNLMAVWRAHGLPDILRECWEAGIVLSGPSAGSLCWHLGGPTDSFGDALAPFTDGLGFLPFSNGVHDDFEEQPRRSTYRRLVAEGVLAPGYASEDGVGLHYVGTELHEAVTVRRGSRAWWVDAHGDQAIDARGL
jgi:peptidase E